MSKQQNSNTISISRKSFFTLILCIIVFLFLIYIRYLVLTLILSFIMASFTKYFAQLMQAKYKINYKYGLIFIFISLLIILITSVALLLPLLIKESYGLIEFINIVLKQIESSLILTGIPIEGLNLSQFSSPILNLGQVTLSILSGLGEIATYTLLIFVLSFYIAINGTGLQALIKLFTPREVKEQIPNIINKLQYHIGKWAFIEVGIALTMGIFIYTVLSILEFQYAAVLGILAGILQLVPILGPVLIYSIIILIAFVQAPILGLITFTLIVTVQLIKQFLLLPIIFKSLKTTNALLVVLSLMIGGVLAGVLGVIIAMPVISLARIVYKDINFYDK
ncbi:MAG: AI-2E family transporter [Minisyncoccia bacterium]